MGRLFMTLVFLTLAGAGTAAAQAEKDSAARIEAIPIHTLTLTDKQFLNGDAYGVPATIAGVLRVAQGSGRLPLVVFLGGSGGLGPNIDPWDRFFLKMGVSTFTIDPFAGRGIVSTVANQAQLGRLNMILDLYRSLEVLGAHPGVDPKRIIVMGFSRGGQAALYSAMTRFHKMWNRSGVEPVAYIPLYPTCNTTLLDDTNLADRPIRIFHGIADDWVPIGPCQEYYQRLLAAGEDVTLTEFTDATHAYDYVNFTQTPAFEVVTAQITHCILKEEAAGVIVNVATGQPFAYSDACVGKGAHVKYSPSATEGTRTGVVELLKTVLQLK